MFDELMNTKEANYNSKHLHLAYLLIL